MLCHSVIRDIQIKSTVSYHVYFMRLMKVHGVFEAIVKPGGK